MLGLTVVCAGASALVASWKLSAVWNAALALLAIAAAAYVVLRLPYVGRELLRLAGEWQQLRQRHAELNAQALARKRALTATKAEAPRAGSGDVSPDNSREED